MVKVKYRLDNGYFRYLSVKGHANSAPYGQDLICASVSAICFGLLNAIDMASDEVEIKIDDNHIEIINNTCDNKINHYIELVIFQFKTIEESYSQYLTIDERSK